MHYQMILYAMSGFYFLPFESIQNQSPGMYAPYKKPTQISRNVRRPISRKPVHRCAAWLTDKEEKQTDLETENK